MNYPYASAQGAKRASKAPLLATAGHVTRKQRDTGRKTRHLEPKGTAERIVMRRALSCPARVNGRHQRHGLLNRAAFADESRSASARLCPSWKNSTRRSPRAPTSSTCKPQPCPRPSTSPSWIKPLQSIARNLAKEGHNHV
jgi:hypothetical protein